MLTDDQVPIARDWLNAVSREVHALLDGSQRAEKDILVLSEDRRIRWEEDTRWDELMRLKSALPGEQ